MKDPRQNMYTVSCPHCGKFICRSSTGSEIEVKCPKCRSIIYFQHFSNGQFIFRDVRVRYKNNAG